MTITSLVENTSCKALPVEHGLSLHIRLDDGRFVLFDMGQKQLFADNAARLNINLSEVDLAIVSHGHYDHGGGLQTFLEINSKANIYLNSHAFEPHYSLRMNGLAYIGLDHDLKDNCRLVFCEGETLLDNGLVLFSNVRGNHLKPTGNKLLFGPTKEQNDDFCHEQNLIIKENDRTVLFAGCAHSGILNIIQKAEEIAGGPLTHVFAGMHLVKSGLSEAEETAFILSLADRLLENHHCQYFTMHCTGLPQYEILKKRMGNSINYLSCGDCVRI